MTSNKTNDKIVQIIDKYLPREKAQNMLAELSEVDGNKSFKDSIQNLGRLLSIKKKKDVQKERNKKLDPLKWWVSLDPSIRADLMAIYYGDEKITLSKKEVEIIYSQEVLNPE